MSSLVFFFAFSSQLSSTLTVYFGRINLDRSNDEEQSKDVSRVIVHPEYGKHSLLNDIALLELSSPVIFSEYVRPVCLAAETSELYAGITCWMTGWGYKKSKGRTEHC